MNKAIKTGIVVALVTVVGVVIAMKANKAKSTKTVNDSPGKSAVAQQSEPLPRLVDLGAGKCIPCKMMAPILEELKVEYADRLRVDVFDVWEDESIGEQFGIRIIPTQIFFSPAGKELWRHEGFLGKDDILAKWKELGYDFSGAELSKVERWEPAKKDARAKDQVCYMCDGDVNVKTAVVVKTDKGDVHMCGLHCYFITYSCLTEDKTGFEKKASVTDYATGKTIPATKAVYLSGLDEKTGRPWVKAFSTRDVAVTEMKSSGGSIVTWKAIQDNELSHRCGFCDRSCYPQDVAKVLIDGVHSYGCCAHCAMGVAARTAKDIEVYQRDGLTGEIILVKTLGGKVASIKPPTAVAWFGKKKTANGKWSSAGCFHQGFFRTPENLKKWLEQHPYETGEMIPIQRSLADKMKLSSKQISKACKIGECAPK